MHEENRVDEMDVLRESLQESQKEASEYKLFLQI